MKKILWICVSLLLLLTACRQGDTPAADPDTDGLTITDAAGTVLSFETCPRRVAALSGSFGEIWVNAGGSLAAATKDAVTERGMELQDTAIVGTIKDPDLEAILAAEPDFVILSADTGSHVEIAATLKNAGIPCGLFKIEAFEDYLKLLKQFCTLTGREDLYEKNGLAIEEAIGQTLAKGPDLSGKTVLLLRAYSSGFKAKDSENMTGVMLKDFGLENILDKYDSLLEEISIEQIIETDPDYIFVTTMGSDEGAALDNLKAAMTGNPAWSGLTAVREGRYHILPRDLFHYKPNARWGESYAHLLKLLEE